MSSNQEIETRRMTSIARKMHWSWIRNKIGLFFGMDLLLFLLLFGGWLADQEYTRLGAIQWDCTHIFALADEPAQGSLIKRFPWVHQKFGGIVYQVVRVEDGDEGDGDEGALRRTVLLEIYVAETFIVLLCLALAIFIFQSLFSFFDYGSEEKKIRRILRPLQDIALKADELNRLTFSEDKYQEIEEAIEKLQPGDSGLLAFGNADLQGIEAAMNNLLTRMRDSYRQQARFVNDASHELRTPIAVIEGYANMLARWGREDEKVLDESITAILHESSHMKHLVEQLLFLARGDSGKTKLTMERVSLRDLMQEVYEESLMIDEEHPYRYQPAAQEVVVSADAMLLKQAVRILVDNAAKYTGSGDEIILGVGVADDGRRYLQVQDTGIGMAGNDVEHMFERFYRAQDARAYQGTGLGLSIAKWIVDKHRGQFEILSRTGLGTRIRVYL